VSLPPRASQSQAGIALTAKKIIKEKNKNSKNKKKKK
jgi:hypothetical protein